MNFLVCVRVCTCVCLRVWLKDCQVLSTERVLAVVNGVAQFLQHHIQRGVLRQFDHEHTGLHTDVA